MPARKLTFQEALQGAPFRLKIVKWKKYQTEGKGDDKPREWVKILTLRPFDTILEEPLSVRGLWWELIRAAGATRRAGWVVAGDNEPMTIERLAFFLRLPKEEIIEPLRRLVETGRVELWTGDVEATPSECAGEQADMTRNHPESLQTISNHSESSQIIFDQHCTSQNYRTKSRVEKSRVEKRRNTTPPTTLAQSNAPRCDCAAPSNPQPSWSLLFEQQITEDKLSTIQEAFPAVDVRLEVRRMRAWLETHPDIAKRRKRFDLMLWRWVRKAQERQDRQKPYHNAKQRLALRIEELRRKGLADDDYERVIKKITAILVNTLVELNPTIKEMSGEAYDKWFALQALELTYLDEQLNGELSTEDMDIVCEFLKHEECKFAVGDARDLRQKWLRILPQARKWWRRYYGA